MLFESLVLVHRRHEERKSKHEDESLYRELLTAISSMF